MKKIIALVLISAMMLTTLVGCGVNRENLYDPANTDIVLGNVFFMEETDNNNIFDENVIVSEKDYIDSLGMNAQNINTVENDEIRVLKGQMTEFFMAEYGVNISDKISGITTKTFTATDNLIMGFHIPGSTEVYVNEIIFNSELEVFAFTWCHEVIHLLGIDYEYNQYWGIYEAVTEAVCCQFMDWINNTGYYNSAYMFASNAGTQMIMANPEIVVKCLTDDDYSIADEINEVLKDATYPIAKLPDDSSIAYQFNAYLVCMIEENDLYLSYPEVFDFFVQEITTAYCRNFNLTEKQIEKAKEYWMISDFDKVTIKDNGNSVSLKR